MLLLSSALVFITFLLSIAVIVYSISDNFPRIIEVIETRHGDEQNIRVVKVGLLKSAKRTVPLRNAGMAPHKIMTMHARNNADTYSRTLPLAA